MNTKFIKLLLQGSVVTLLLCCISSPSWASEALGVWEAEEGEIKYQIASCNSNLCATAVWLKEPNDPSTGKPKTDKNNADKSKQARPLIGIEMFLDMKPEAPGKWRGRGYNYEDGEYYAVTVETSGKDSLKVQGCAVGGLICETFTWQRSTL